MSRYYIPELDKSIVLPREPYLGDIIRTPRMISANWICEDEDVVTPYMEIEEWSVYYIDPLGTAFCRRAAVS